MTKGSNSTEFRDNYKKSSKNCHIKNNYETLLTVLLAKYVLIIHGHNYLMVTLVVELNTLKLLLLKCLENIKF